MEAFLRLHRFTGGTKAYPDCCDSGLAVYRMGRLVRIAWLRISIDCHSFGLAGLGSMATAVLYPETEVELGYRGY